MFTLGNNDGVAYPGRDFCCCNTAHLEHPAYSSSFVWLRTVFNVGFVEHFEKQPWGCFLNIALIELVFDMVYDHTTNSKDFPANARITVGLLLDSCLPAVRDCAGQYLLPLHRTGLTEQHTRSYDLAG